jgi:hypothetical protein
VGTGVVLPVVMERQLLHKLFSDRRTTPVPTDLSALIQRRQSRVQVNLTPAELELLDSVATRANSSRSNLARSLMLNSIKELQAAWPSTSRTYAAPCQ